MCRNDQFEKRGIFHDALLKTMDARGIFDGESLGARADGGAAMLLSDPSVLIVHGDWRQSHLHVWMVVCSAGSLWFIREAYCVCELGRPD